MILTKEDVLNEIWTDVIDYEGLYQISNMGRVKSVDRCVPHGLGENSLRCIKGKNRNLFKNNRDYTIVVLYKNGKGCTCLVSRLVAIHHIDNPENKPDVNHKFGNKDDNRHFMLEWSTKIENTQHAIRTGLINQNGEDSMNSKLKDKQILEIRRLSSEGIKNIELSSMFNTCNQNISLIVNRKAWKHI